MRAGLLFPVKLFQSVDLLRAGVRVDDDGVVGNAAIVHAAKLPHAGLSVDVHGSPSGLDGGQAKQEVVRVGRLDVHHVGRLDVARDAAVLVAVEVNEALPACFDLDALRQQWPHLHRLRCVAGLDDGPIAVAC